ncbi:MAG: hypothetical protein COT90_01770 [Candidatus Diapherotrites archaeon CG10_big_fil_rev_8_21_14_0_10_31_34]|nr:MAG: hypothetical protein COT90_01770 [Candidatus Diapherotrites archaeon CG10_big_fil_rev_8_21_14_0_10_31_34]
MHLVKMKKTELIKISKNIGLLLITVILMLVFFEITLRSFPGIAGNEIHNSLLSKFYIGGEGILLFDEKTGIFLLKPNIQTTVYKNNYYWKLKTDSKGFRNEKEINQADIILVGDSIIYGTGLNYEKTTPFFLQKQTGLTVFNLSREGDSSFEQKFLLNKYASELKPKYILYFFFENDIYNLSESLTENEMNYFVEKQKIDDFSVKRGKNFESNPDNPYYSQVLEKNHLFIFTAIKTFINSAKNREHYKKNLNKSFDINSVEWKYQEKTIKQMKTFSDSINTEFILISITNKKIIYEKIKQITEENEIPLIEVEELIEYNKNSMFKDEFVLKGDGHLNEEGHKKLTEILTNYLNKKT